MTWYSDVLSMGSNESDESARQAEAERAAAQREAESAFKDAQEKMAKLQAEAAQAAAVAAADRAQVNLRKQALYDAAFLVAAADGSFSDQERAKLAIGLQGLLGDNFSESDSNEGLETARALRDEKGLKGAAEDIAARISDQRERGSLLTVASVVGWLNGGVGTKEGLALQALAAAFGFPLPKLHEIMAVAHKVAKS
ncbi:MAG: hypothetical protein HOW73_14295 [Polyangiaceae bacterium]|nr:hypothetical protein [Polyangiaceae bacterium]